MNEIHDLINSAKAEKRPCNVPSGVWEISEPIIPFNGLQLIGSGSSDATGPWCGTQIVPADGYDGHLIYSPLGNKIVHHCTLRDFKVSGSRSHGIFMEDDTGENFFIDGVSAIGNAGDGIRIQQSIPCVIGRVSCHANGGSGLALKWNDTTHIGFISGDNNGKALLHVDVGNSGTSIYLGGFKSERWGDCPGNPDIILIENMNGGTLTIGHGHVLSSENVQNGNAVINIQGTGAVVNSGLITLRGNGSYNYGVFDGVYGKHISATNFWRHEQRIRPNGWV